MLDSVAKGVQAPPSLLSASASVLPVSLLHPLSSPIIPEREVTVNQVDKGIYEDNYEIPLDKNSMETEDGDGDNKNNQS